MPTHIIFLVLFAALLHASWNALLRSGADRLWSMTVMCIAIAIASVVAAAFMVPPAIESWGYAVLSGLLHVGYNLFLVRSYRVGDLGQIYPIARGSSPVLITLGAAVFAGERITPEEIWACTTCKACDEICPVNIEILDKILDMRRYLALMESDFPATLGNVYRSMENSSNVYGMNQGDRGAWADDLEGIEIMEPGVPATTQHEYLMWVGCAGSFDDRNKKTSRALAKLLQRADIDFAILGPSELCTGDSARRSGNEYIFQMLAMQNIEMLDGAGVTKIITQCPHCFNTLANE